jgi:hypothetical protein
MRLSWARHIAWMREKAMQAVFWWGELLESGSLEDKEGGRMIILK